MSLSEEKVGLLALWEERRKEFEQCHELQTFLRDAEQMEERMQNMMHSMPTDSLLETFGISQQLQALFHVLKPSKRVCIICTGLLLLSHYHLVFEPFPEHANLSLLSSNKVSTGRMDHL